MSGRRRGCIFRKGRGYAIKLELPPDPVTGKRRYHREFGFPTKKEAEDRLAELGHKLQTGIYVEPAKVTVSEYLDRWLEAVRPTLSPRTFQGYEANLRRHVRPYIGHVLLPKLQPLALQELYSRLLEQGLAPKTVLYVHTTLHRALEMAVKWGLVGRNVTDAVEPPKQQRKEMLALDDRQAATLLAGITDLRLKVPVALALGCGLRRGEVLGLRWEDVDLEAGRVQVVQTLQWLPGEGLKTLPTKTHRSRRPVDLPPGVVAVLKAWRKQQAQERLAAGPVWEETGAVCTRPNGLPLDPQWVSKCFGRVVKRLGLPPVRFHDLRHSHATLLLKKGVHPKVVQERLGHSAINVTLDVYSHVLPGMQKEAALAIDGIFRTASPEGGRV